MQHKEPASRPQHAVGFGDLVDARLSEARPQAHQCVGTAISQSERCEVPGDELVTRSSCEEVDEFPRERRDPLRLVHHDQPGAQRGQLTGSQADPAAEQHHVAPCQGPERLQGAGDLGLDVKTACQLRGEIVGKIDGEVGHGSRV